MRTRKTMWAILQGHYERQLLIEASDTYTGKPVYKYNTFDTIVELGSRETITSLWTDFYCNIPGAKIGKKRIYVNENESPETLKSRITNNGFSLYCANHI